MYKARNGAKRYVEGWVTIYTLKVATVSTRPTNFPKSEFDKMGRKKHSIYMEPVLKANARVQGRPALFKPQYKHHNYEYLNT